MPARVYQSRLQPGIALVAAIVLLAVPKSAVSQEPSPGGTANVPVRSWADRGGTHHTDATFVELKDGQVALRKKDGTVIHISLDRLSDADQAYVKSFGMRVTGADSAKFDISKPAEATVTNNALPQSKEVVVTGIGVDPEKALQNAFSQAIEQTVGLLVDAETVVKNDKLIRDEVLTYSRGYMENFEIVKRWQEDGLHHATILATVARDKLVAKLKGMKLAMVDTPGELKARQFEFDAKNEEQAAEMFKKALTGFDMKKLVKVTIIGEPLIEKQESGANVHIKVMLSPDPAGWNPLAKDLRLILSKTSTRRAVATTRTNQRHDSDKIASRDKSESTSHRFAAGDRLKVQIDGRGAIVGLLSKWSSDGVWMDWDMFRVPTSIADTINVPWEFQLVYSLIDERGDEIARVANPMRLENLPCYPPLNRDRGCFPIYARWVGPIWSNGHHLRSVVFAHADLSISSDDLKRLSKTVVFLEKYRGKR
jgi:hypothetical protein